MSEEKEPEALPVRMTLAEFYGLIHKRGTDLKGIRFLYETSWCQLPASFADVVRYKVYTFGYHINKEKGQCEVTQYHTVEEKDGIYNERLMFVHADGEPSDLGPVFVRKSL